MPTEWLTIWIQVDLLGLISGSLGYQQITQALTKSLSMNQHVKVLYEPVHEISNNVVSATSKASDQPAHTRSLIRAFVCRLSIL